MYELHRAVKKRDSRRVSELLAHPPGVVDVNQPDPKGWTPLMYALADSPVDKNLVRTLIDYGTTIDPTTISFALGDLQTLTLLLDAGANILYVTEKGYDSLINAAYGRNVEHNPELLDILKLLIAKGVPLRGMTTFGESAVRVLSRIGRFDAVQLLLREGANPDDVQLTPLLRAVAFGTLEDIASLVQSGASLEERDYWDRTAWLVAVQTGDIAKAQFLLDHGADRNVRGRCGKPTLFYAVQNGDVPMLKWLLDLGLDVEHTDEFGRAALGQAVECCHEECVKILLNAGANVDAESRTGTALANATTRGTAMKLLAAGADPQYLSGKAKREILGLPLEPDDDFLETFESDFWLHRTRSPGEHNPELMNNPFWEGMIRSGISAYQAGQRFGLPEPAEGYRAIWCAQRFGQSLTFLPDGRRVQIGGEHEDHYDCDFCIYNDVFVHSPDGSIIIYGYPESVFPPTDFHTATLIGDSVYLIGSLGYPDARRYGQTPVYRLDTKTFEMEPLQTSGEVPGWIYEQRAVHSVHGEIRISGGIVVSLKDGKEEHSHNSKVFVLDIERRAWRRE